MATARLESQRTCFLAGLARAWVLCYAALWTATIACVLVVMSAGDTLKVPARDLLGAHLGPSRNPPPRLTHVLLLTLHNLPIAAWPLLLGVEGAHRRAASRRLADVLLTTCVAVNVLLVGTAIGAYGSPLLAYIPQLPLEWAAVALGGASWVRQRSRALTPREGILCALLIAAVVLGAAVLETLAVPHR